MDEKLLKRVLSCSKLPSVPAVALRVIELTSDPNVSMRTLAETIQNDQGLATKILRTVNSPFYGLVKRCSTIQQAQLMLGLNGVKTLALGFSLVNSLKQNEDHAFDYVSYWRRGVYSAVGSRAAARMIGCPFAEEAFLGGLLQDLGVVALYMALGDEYSALLEHAHTSHEELGRLEVDRLEIHHAEVGAMLADRWRLPDSLIAPIRFHERPSAAPREHQGIVQSVYIGNLVASALTLQPAGPWVQQLRRTLAEFAKAGHEQADTLVEETGKGAVELSRLLDLDTGKAADVCSVLESAKDRLVEIAMDGTRQSERTARLNDELQRELETDATTGVSSRAQFNAELADRFTRARAGGEPLSLAIIDPDKLRRINEDHGWEVGDAVLAALARRLVETFRAHRGVVGRWGADEFAVLLDRTDMPTAAAMLQRLCADLSTNPIEPTGVDLPERTLMVTASAGVATFDPASQNAFARPEHLLHAADQALHAAQAAGGHTVRVFSPRAKAAA